MDYQQQSITGSVLENLEEFLPAQIRFETIKTLKLKEREPKYIGKTEGFYSVLAHLTAEVFEVCGAVSKAEEPDAVLKELADVSNCVDILAMLVIRAEKPGGK